MEKIKLGDHVDTKHGISKINHIELMPEMGMKEDGIPMKEIWAIDKDRCVFDLENGHWAYGDQVTKIPF